jgi:hypothetical protein
MPGTDATIQKIFTLKKRKKGASLTQITEVHAEK